MADTTSLSALPLSNNVQNSENITLQTNERPQGQVPQGQAPQGQVPQGQASSDPMNMKQANPPQYVPPNSQQAPPPQLSQDMISQVVNGIQEASKIGVTDLPSRDIPIDTSRIVQDEQVQPNFIPSHPDKPDYIQNYETQAEIHNQNVRINNQTTQLDNIYNEIQAPLLIGVLFFIFQLPFFQKFVKRNFKILYTSDGNINMSGYLFKTALFAGSYYCIQKSMRRLSSF